ncbi:MAG: isoprenoid biosynthesis glyoxalase ElbB [Oligoflexales bacterium]
MKKFAVVLSGCGHQDGSEITESVSTLIALSQKGYEYECFAPDIEVEVINHVTGKPSGKRGILAESARIARGNIRPVSELKAANFSGVIFPGGYGAAVKLSTWGNHGAGCTVLPEIKFIIEDFYNAKKAIGAMCIAPTLVAKVLGSKKVKVTIGEDKETAQEIEKTGARHEVCAVDSCVVDVANKVVTTPAYMYDAKPHQVFAGISALVNSLGSL